MPARAESEPGSNPAAKPDLKPSADTAPRRGLGRRGLGLWGPWRLFWLGLGVRLLAVSALHFYRITPVQDHFKFGYEMGRIARALATGHGYANPFYGQTGPTAWVTPLYPLLMAGVFKLFGVYSALSAWVLLAIGSLMNALMIPLIWATARRLFSPRVALWSAWIWALYPAAMQYAVKWIWEMTLTTLLFQAALLLALAMRGVGDEPTGSGSVPEEAVSVAAGSGASWTRWLVFGLLWGLIALSNPGLLLFLPVCGVWVLAAKGRAWWRDLPNAVAAGLVFLAVLAPWVIRNTLVFHTFVPLRNNFGAELYLGNGPGATGFLMEYDHPYQAVDQYRAYKSMGEIAFAHWRGELAMRTIRADYARFLRLCATRVYFFWWGIPEPDGKPLEAIGRGLNYGFSSMAGLLGLALALRRKRPAAGLIAAAFLLIPATYYLITAHARFRHPLEPLIAIFAVYLLQSAELRWGGVLAKDARTPGRPLSRVCHASGREPLFASRFQRPATNRIRTRSR